MLVKKGKGKVHHKNGRAPVAPPTLVKLDLGCGQNKREGFLGVDIADCPGVDVVHDLRQTPWPWADESVSEVFSSHFFEHLTGPERMAFMEELYRILVPGGKARIVTPYYSSMRAVQDPTHAWPPVCEASYLYFNKGWREANRLNHYPITVDFDFVYGYAMRPDVANRHEEARNFMVQNYLNAVQDLDVTLTKRPGPDEKDW